MQDFIGVEGVMDRERLQALSRRSNARGLVQLASHLGVLAANTVALAYTWGTWWGVPLFILQGILINFLYAPQHEANHWTAFESKWLNDWVARLCGFLALRSSDYERWEHFAHHRNTQNWEKDPELLMRRPFTSAGQYLLMFSGIQLLEFRFRMLVRHARGDFPEWFLTGRQRRLIAKSSRWHLGLYAAIAVAAVALETWWPLTLWVLPYAATKWVYWMQGLGEHTGLTHEPNTLRNTRTFRTNWFMRWVNWNMTYHTVHHTYPGVPFFALPRLHREVEAAFGALPTDRYFRFHWGMVRALLAGKNEHEICGDAPPDAAAAPAPA